MCNLYSHMRSQAEVRSSARAMRQGLFNLAPMPGIFPDYPAPIVRTGADGVRELAMARWGMPSSRQALYEAATRRADRLRAKGQPVDFDQLLRMEPDGGTTNVRNTSSKHWKPWLEPGSRCLVPLTSFSEPGVNAATGKSEPWWFALSEERPLAFFAGIWVPAWTSVRKVKTGEETIDLFAFLTCEPNAEVRPIHPKAMPVILTTADEIEAWMTAPWSTARELQRPLPDGALQVVARGARQDPPAVPEPAAAPAQASLL